MNESRPFQADVHERGFHAGQHPNDLALVDVADNPLATGALDIGFLQHAVFNEGDPGFHRSHVDQDLFTHAWLSLLHGQWRQTGSPASANNSAVSCRGKPTTAL